jgi:spore coat protein H
MLRVAIQTFLALAAMSGAQTDWALSGKVVDAEEGNGLNAVEVSLLKAGLRTTTAKNGSWTIATGVGVRSRPAMRGTESFLRLVDGRLSLRLDGVDIRGRRMDGAKPPSPVSAAARALETVTDTLVFSRDGFVQKRVPLSMSSIAGMVDSLRRIRYEGWVDSSHSNGYKPDTLNGFLRAPRTLTLRWSKKSWDAMMQAMTDSCGAFGTKGAGDATSKLCSESQFDYIEKSAMIWVPADIETDGRVWKNVGVRLKGNWSLRSAWTSKNYALPFRINTDKFEDSLPETKNQRFYGFKKISLFNAVQDASGIRGAVAGSIFRQSGVVAPLSVPVRLVIKFGDTTKEVGAYEMVEIPDNPLLNRYFKNDSGNLYKPESKLDQYVASQWVDEDVPGDRTDVKNLISVINAGNRTSDTATWHRNLEAVLDVDGFLRWLATSTVIMNWDAYGVYAHNYYLFNDKGRFRWITFDFGNSFNYTMGSRTSIWFDEPASPFAPQGPWPLIKNLLADKNYCEAYRSYAQKALGGPASVQNFQSLVDKYGPWISNVPSTVTEVSRLRTFMTGRITEVQNSLGNKTCPIR